MKDRFLELLQSNNVDRAIIVKWSKSGLKKIRIMAWQLIEGEHLRFAND